MARYWSEDQLDQSTPPQVLDERGRAMVRFVDQYFAARPVSTFDVKNPATCPAEMLPALIAEYSMHEFIEPDLPEFVIRRILQNHWMLKFYKGYDHGVLLGLSLLGLTASIEQWWQVEPKRQPHTHRLTFFVSENLYPGEPAALNERTTRAALRMNEAMKRYSQESEVIVGARLKLPVARVSLRASSASILRARLTLGQRAARARVDMSLAARHKQTASVASARMTLGQQAPAARLHLKTAARAQSAPLTKIRMILKGGK